MLKKKNYIEDFALGNKNLDTITLALKLVTICISSSTFCWMLQSAYNLGILTLLPIISIIGNLLITIYILLPRIACFSGKLSLVEMMGSIYGNEVRIIAAIFSIVISAIRVAVELKVFAIICNYFFGVDVTCTILSGSLIVIYHSIFRHYKAAVLTDILCLYTFGAFIPTLVSLIWNLFGSVYSIQYTLSHNYMFNPSCLLDYNSHNVLQFYGLMLYYLIPDLNSAMFHKILITNNIQKTTTALKITICIIVFFFVSVTTLSLILLSADLVTDNDNLLPYIITVYSYPWLKSLFLIGIIAMIISTTNSWINSSKAVFIYDICSVLNITFHNSRLQRITNILYSVVVGLLSIYIAISRDNIFDILMLGASLYTPIIGVPLLVTVLGFRSTSKVMFAGIGAGTLTLCILNKYFANLCPIGTVIPATIVNFVVILATHRFLGVYGGWIGMQDSSILRVIKEKRKQGYRNIINFYYNRLRLCTWNNLIIYCNDNLFYKKKHYIACYFFTILSLTLMVISNNIYYIDCNYSMMITTIIILSSFITTTIFLYLDIILEEYLRKYLAILWHIAIFITLIISNIMLTLIGGFVNSLTAYCLINLVAVSILIKWPIAILMIFIGIPVATTLFSTIIQYDNITIYKYEINYLHQHLASILLAMIGVISFIKIRQDQFVDDTKSIIKLQNKILSLTASLNTKDQKMDLLCNSKKYIFNNLSTSMSFPLSIAYTSINLLHRILPKYYDSHLLVKEKTKVLTLMTVATDSVNRSISLSNDLIDLSKFNSGNMVFNIELNNLKLLIAEGIEEFNKTHMHENHVITLDYSSEAEIVFELDKERVKQVILTIISNSVKYSRAGVISIKVIPYRQGAEILIEDEGVCVPNNELKSIFEPSIESSTTKSSTRRQGVGLTVACEVIKGHHGKIWAENRANGYGNRFILRLPLRQPIHKFNHTRHNLKKIFGTYKTIEERITQIRSIPAFSCTINTLSSVKELEEHTRVDKSIMIIDNDQNFLDSVSLDIYAEGYYPTPVNNPFETVKLLKESPTFYSLIILSMYMPGKSGEQVIKDIKDISGIYSIPVIVISEDTQSAKQKTLLYSLGVSSIMKKPYTAHEVRNIINLYLRQTENFPFNIDST